MLSITIGENESAKFWLSVLNELKNRGVKDIFVLCADELTGICRLSLRNGIRKLSVMYGERLS